MSLERRIGGVDYVGVEQDALRILDSLCRQASVSAEARDLDETAELVDELLVGAGEDIGIFL